MPFDRSSPLRTVVIGSLAFAATTVSLAVPAPAAAQLAFPERTMGHPDPRRNLVLDAQSAGIRVLAPVPLYAKGEGGFADWPGRVAGAKEVEQDGALFNVSDPSYQAFLPPTARNSRTAVIVAPGGGFRQLSIYSEGSDVAQWLAARGIAAFVLKYRLVQQKGPQMSMMARLGEIGFDDAGAPAVADGAAAIRHIRARAKEYGIDSNKIVFIGFSAGAHVAAYQALNKTVADRADYVAPIYGAPLEAAANIPPRFLPGTVAAASGGLFAPPPTGTPNPDALPPIFLAGSQDDFLVGKQVRAFYEALLEAGYQPEAHFYANGLHGYGLNETKSTSRHFIEQFYWWMESMGLTRKPGDPDNKLVPVDLQALMRGAPGEKK